MKLHLNSPDPDCYLDLHQIAHTRKYQSPTTCQISISFMKIHELFSEKSMRMLKIWLGPFLTHDHKFRGYLSSSFCIILLTSSQTSADENLPGSE